MDEVKEEAMGAALRVVVRAAQMAAPMAVE